MVQLKASSEMIPPPGIMEDSWKRFKQNFVAARNGMPEKGRQSEQTFIFWQ